MKEMDDKFIQLYGKKNISIVYDAKNYEKSKTDFALGYKCGFDAGLEAQEQEADYKDEKQMEDILSRGG